jgi:hypothetical protein
MHYRGNVHTCIQIITCLSDYRRHLDSMIGFIDDVQVVTTNNYYTVSDFHITNHSALSLLSLFPLVITC